MNEFEDIIPTDVLKHVKEYSIDFQNKSEYTCFKNVYRKVIILHQNVIDLWDPRTNCFIWANDVFNLIDEILYEFIWLKSWAEYYKTRNEEGSKPSHYYFHANFCADNCITRIDSCRDKIALMIWSYFCHFNPEKKEEILIFEKIVERLQYPIKFALGFKQQTEFVNYLNLLKGGSFQRIEKYRHFKIHRLEPYMEIFGVKDNHGLGYLIPQTTKKQMIEFDAKLRKQHPNYAETARDIIKVNCYYENVLFDRERIKEQMWNYEDIQKDLNSCIYNIMTAMSCICIELMNREPFDKHVHMN